MAVTKTINGVEHPASHFLVVGDPEKPSTWALPVMGADGKPDMRHMGAAWAALHEGFRGNKYEGPSKEEATNKLKRMYQTMGKQPPGTMKGLFYRADDDLWFVGIYSNNFEDVEGEIFSEKAHEEYVQWLKETGVKPPITILHQPRYKDAVHIMNYMGLAYKKISPQQYNENLRKLYKPYAIADTKTVFTTNGFTFVVGRVYDNKRKVIERLMERASSWGMSHGFLTLDSQDGVINKYRTFEFSLLPDFAAANKITPIGFVRKDTMGSKEINKEDQEIIEDLLNGSAEDIEEATQKAKEVLSPVLGSKEIDVLETESYEQIRTKIFADLQVDGMVATFKEMAQRMETLQKSLETATSTITTLEAAVATLKKSDDEKVAAQFEQINWHGLLGAKEEKPQDKEIIEQLKENLPVDDKQAAKDNPLQLGFWNVFSS